MLEVQTAAQLADEGLHNQVRKFWKIENMDLALDSHSKNLN